MPLPFTRTQTAMWSWDSLAPLRAALDSIQRDFTERRPYIDQAIADAMANRIEMASIVIGLMGEPAG